MIIPKCCKGCSGRRSGVCNCTLPSYCNEWVEDNGSEPVTPNAPLPWNVNQTDSSKNKDKIYVGDPYPYGVAFSGNEKKCQDCEQKDKRIAVLEKALNMLIDKLLENEKFPCCFCYKQSNCNLKCSCPDTNEATMYLIEEAEKELEEKKYDNI